MVDESGAGAVLIWGWALPFLGPPPTAAAADLPMLNLVVYEGGVPTFYHLEQFDPALVAPVPGGWRFGANVLQSECVGGDWRVRAYLDLCVAGSTGRAVCELRLDGPAAFGHPKGRGPHQWSILSAPATASLRLNAPGLGEVGLRGRGYHDENCSDRPLGALGISEWAWGRIAEPECDRIHYTVQGRTAPVQLDVLAEPSGRLILRPLERLEGEGRIGGRWGFSAPRYLLTDAGRLESGPVVDESSFYLRFALNSGAGRGWGERVRPAAIDSAWMQSLVKMCVTRPDGGSPMLPWFSGARADRAERLWSWWTR